MNIKLLLCSILIGTFTCCSNKAQEQEYSDRDYQLIYPDYSEIAMLKYGKASSISVKDYKWVDGKTTKPVKRLTLKVTYQWELDGIFLKEIVEFIRTNYVEVKNFISKDGKIIDSISVYRNQEGSYFSRDNSIKEKNSSQWLIRYKDKEEIDTLSVHYSENKMNIQHKYFRGRVSIRNTFYNEKGNIIKESYGDGNEPYYPTYIFEYGPNGFKNKATVTELFGSQWRTNIYTIEYEFDKRGNWIEQTWYDADGNAKSLTERTIVYK